ncbi:TcpQ domain-containing protein [Glaciecola siphonariae]|uniref:TcpQ domain-containing protein n=1 Tax=Glaciecola siphonariae TaxID=521012 RepID=A0ABV9LUI0_9ALTE
MGFWAKRILIIIVVIVGAIAAILYMPQEPKLDAEGNVIEKKSIQSNMAKFYEEFSLTSSDKIEEELGEFVIPLDQSDTPLEQQIAKLQHSPSSSNDNFDWQDNYKARAFAKDSTLMDNAMMYVSEEGMELIWHLNQDFVVRHRFISHNTIAGMLGELAGAVDANFVRTVQVYYCDVQRVMVITDKEDAVLEDRCMRLSQTY